MFDQAFVRSWLDGQSLLREAKEQLSTVHRPVRGAMPIDRAGPDHAAAVASILGGETLGVANKVKLVFVRVADCDGRFILGDTESRGTIVSLRNGLDWLTSAANHNSPRSGPLKRLRLAGPHHPVKPTTNPTLIQKESQHA